MEVGTDALTRAEVGAYVAKGWLREGQEETGPTFIIRPTSVYMQVWYTEPCQAASLSTGRFAAALDFMGIERSPRVPPQGGPTGAPFPLGSPSSILAQRPNGVQYIQRAVYQKAELALGRQAGDAPVCFRFLAQVGCTRKGCPLRHLQLSPAVLQQRCQVSPLLQAVFAHHGGVRGSDPAQPRSRQGRRLHPTSCVRQ